MYYCSVGRSEKNGAHLFTKSLLLRMCVQILSRADDRLTPLIFRIHFKRNLKASMNYKIVKCQRLSSCQGIAAGKLRDDVSSNSFLCLSVFPVHPVQRRRMRMRQASRWRISVFHALLHSSIHSSCIKSVHYRFCKQEYTKMTTRLTFSGRRKGCMVIWLSQCTLCYSGYCMFYFRACAQSEFWTKVPSIFSPWTFEVNNDTVT